MRDLLELFFERFVNMFNLSFTESGVLFGQYKEARRDLKNRLVAFLEELVAASGLSNRSAGFLIRATHFFSPLVLIYSVMFHPKYIAYLSILGSAAAVGFFVLFGGCFLSKLEQRLCGDDLIITDPFIELCGDEVNAENRMYYTIFIMCVFVCVYSTALFMRFGRGFLSRAASGEA